MATLTPEEKDELRRLRAEEAAADADTKGDEAVTRQRAARSASQSRPPAQATRPFSIYRATVGALRDAAQGMIDTVQDMGLAALSGNATTVYGPALGTAVEVLKTVAPGQTGIVKAALRTKEVRKTTTLPTLEGEERAGTAEKIVRGIGSFAVPFAGASKLVGVSRAAGVLGRVGRGMVAGAATDFSQVDPVSGNMANVLKDAFGIKSDALDSLASDDDDERFEQRAKAALAGAPLGVVGDAVFELGAKGIRAYRAWKGSADEAAATVDAIKANMGLDPKARNLPTVQAEAQAAGDAAQAGARDGGSLNRDLSAGEQPRAGAEDAQFTEAPGNRAYNPQTDVNTKPAPENFEDVVEYIKRNIGDHTLAEDDVARFAENLLFDSPENALAKIGIDPAKLDFSAYDDPDMLGRLQKGMAELYETYASKLGRSNIRVTERETAKAARALASTADTLKNLHGSTSNLAEELTASRMFIGAHAHKLLAQADEAADEIIKGGAGPKWEEFLASFHRHAYYLGTVRGAGSEVGRALRSLQMLAKTKKPVTRQAASDLATAVEKNAGEQARHGPKGFTEGASAYADRLTTDAEKLLALKDLRDAGGDVGEVTRKVRQGNMTVLRRVDEALRETMGNLFSIGTATYNILAGGAMLGSRTLERAMSTASRLALAVGGGQEAGVAARVAFMDTWAYAHGIVSGFGEAFHNMTLLLEKEGGAELTLNADTLGLSGIAKEMAARSIRSGTELGERAFERAETETYRNFAVLPQELRAIQDTARALPGPKFFQEGMAALSRIGAAAINAAGSASRLGTILYINLPDQFVGTLAARAGSYSAAVRQAAREAAEMGLDGKELTQFLKARTVQISERPTVGWSEDGFEAGIRESAGAIGTAEAKEVLFQDNVEWAVSRSITNGLGSMPMMHLIVPFIKTPMRILERTAIDYTPLGILKDRVRLAIAQGGPARDEAIARMSLGITAIATAYALADDRTIVGKDGGYTSSARLSRPSYSLKIGDDVYEFSRIDPFGTLLGFGADMRRFYHDIEDDPDRDSKLMDFAEGMIWATTANILSKTWLTSLRNLTDLAGATSDEDAATRLSKAVQSTAVRFVPGSGVQRQLEAFGDETMRQAMTFNDALIKSSVGAGTLPVRRDPLLGRPVPLDGLVRVVGVRGSPSPSEVDDPLGAEVERLSFRVPGSRRKVEGVTLTAAQYSRFLELKGQVVKNPETGLTLEQTLTALVKLPEYSALTDRQRVGAIREEMDGFTRLATDQLLKEDKGFAYKALQQEVFDRVLNKDGGTASTATAETARLAQQLGLSPQ